ncbi:MAG: hypothetical protein ACKODG_13870, partial [Betaproteobacteria bacterium]
IDVLAGPSKTVTLDADGSLGELTRAAGNLKLNVFGFAQLEGNFAFQKSSANVKLAPKAGTVETVAVDLLAVGGEDINAFVGINGGSDDQIGLALADVDFALALMTSKTDASRKWTTLEATAGSVSFDGIDGLTVAGSNLSIIVNQADKAGDAVVDHKASVGSANELKIPTSSTSSRTLAQDGAVGELIEARGHLLVDLFGFARVDGNFAASRRYETITLSDGSKIEGARVLTIGGKDIDAFAGINSQRPDRIGLALDKADFALALISDHADTTRSFTSLKATAQLASFVGVQDLTVAASDLEVQINRGIKLPFEAEKRDLINTLIDLSIPADFVGDLSFTREGKTGTARVGARETDAQLILKLTAALETVVGPGNVKVTGNRIEGFRFEFIGSLAGLNVAGLTVASQAAAITATVTTPSAAVAGTSEVKQLVVQSLRSEPDPVAVSITTPVAPQAGLTEISSITFTRPAQSGTYDVFFVDGGVVRTDQSAVAGVSELQRLVLTGDLAAQASGATGTVSVVQPGGGVGRNERYAVTFSNKFGFQGFKLFFVDNPVLPTTWTYRNNAESVADTIGQLKNAYAALLKGYTDNQPRPEAILVSEDKTYTGTGHRYLVEFVGALAGKDIPAIGMRSESKTFSNVRLQQGAAAQSEQQKLSIDTKGAKGSFALSLTVGTRTFTTTGIEFGANAATIRYALNTALGSAGSVEVGSSGAGVYLITFGGALASVDVNLLSVSINSSQPVPAGTLTLSYGGQTTAPISFDRDGATLARRVQTALDGLSSIGAGNVRVGYNAQQSSGAQLGLDLQFTGSLAQKDVAAIAVNGAGLTNAAAAIRTVTPGVNAVAQKQWVGAGPEAIDKGFRLALTWQGKV